MLVTVTLRMLVSKAMGAGGITDTLGSTPPSVPIWIQLGPDALGSGTPPSRPSLGHHDGNPAVVAAGTMPTSVRFETPGTVGGGQNAPTVGGYWAVPPVLPHARNHERLKVRSLATLRMRKRYGLGSTVILG